MVVPITLSLTLLPHWLELNHMFIIHECKERMYVSSRKKSWIIGEKWKFLLSIYNLTQMWGPWKSSWQAEWWPPKDVYVLVPRTWEYVTLYAEGALQIWLRILIWGDFPRQSYGPCVIPRVLISKWKRESGESERFEEAVPLALKMEGEAMRPGI